VPDKIKKDFKIQARLRLLREIGERVIENKVGACRSFESVVE
jgi:hypothetical protein